jgi:hypothetical protein
MAPLPAVLPRGLRHVLLAALQPTYMAARSPPSWSLDVRFRSKADIEVRQSDVWFTPESGHSSARLGCPLCAKSRQSAPQQITLLDHLVSGNEQSLRHRDAERLRSLEINHQVEFRRLFDWEIRWFSAF